MSWGGGAPHANDENTGCLSREACPVPDTGAGILEEAGSGFCDGSGYERTLWIPVQQIYIHKLRKDGNDTRGLRNSGILVLGFVSDLEFLS